MKTYATLRDMGIRNPDQIKRYTLYASEHMDYLRIVYKRQQGSLLPESRRYKFPRSKKTVLVDSGTGQTETMFESSQYVRSAVSELDAIVSKRDSVDEIRRVLNEEIVQLEEEVAERIANIKSLVQSIK